MALKNCAACSKLVYPVEKLSCLDKTWHKSCFKCQVCGMTLNMKNYKGYDKKPYCNAHYPQTKHTAVADTPENRRIAKNTAIQSQIQYHNEFEKSKGKYTVVTDDPETQRIKKNTQNISMVQYHADFEKAKGSKISVPDDPETSRVKKLSENISNVAYHGELERKQEMEQRRPSQSGDQAPAGYRRQPGSLTDYDPMSDQSAHPSPYSAKSTGATVFNSQAPGQVGAPTTRKVGSIADYDPVHESYGSLVGQGYRQENSQIDTATINPFANIFGIHFSSPPSSGTPGTGTGNSGYMSHSRPTVDVGWRPIRFDPRAPPTSTQYYPARQPQQQQQYQPPHEPTPQYSYQPPPQHAPPARSSKGPVYVAIYDYDAADDDEVSFTEGDNIIDVEHIDDGWMTGTVQRTGQQGMLPSNYVERV